MFLIGGIFWIDSDSLYFLGVVAMVGTILMVKGESKFSVDNFSIILRELVVVMLMSDVSRTLNTCSVVASNTIVA